MLWSRARPLTSLDKPRRIQFPPLFDIPLGPVFQTLLKVTGCCAEFTTLFHCLAPAYRPLPFPPLPSSPVTSMTRNSLSLASPLKLVYHVCALVYFLRVCVRASCGCGVGCEQDLSLWCAPRLVRRLERPCTDEVCLLSDFASSPRKKILPLSLSLSLSVTTPLRYLPLSGCSTCLD